MKKKNFYLIERTDTNEFLYLGTEGIQLDDKSPDLTQHQAFFLDR